MGHQPWSKLESKMWKKIALRFARAILRFERDAYANIFPESTVKLAKQIVRRKRESIGT